MVVEAGAGLWHGCSGLAEFDQTLLDCRIFLGFIPVDSVFGVAEGFQQVCMAFIGLAVAQANVLSTYQGLELCVAQVLLKFQQIELIIQQLQPTRLVWLQRQGRENVR